MPLRVKGSWTEGLEPACWGSAELPLVPESLERACRGTTIDGFKISGRGSTNGSVVLQLSSLASPLWRELIGEARPVDASLSLLDRAVAAIEILYETNPDALDIPFLQTCLDRLDHASSIPFETRTWRLIVDAGVSSDLDITLLISGTFRELMDRLGDGRAALDIAVTGPSWVRSNDHDRCGVLEPHLPETLEAAVDLLAVRAFRCAGRKTTNDQYSAKWADAIGKRLGVGSSTRWTLDACGQGLRVTRERVRQVEKAALWDATVRKWGRPAVLEELNAAVLEGDIGGDVTVSTGETVSRADAVEILVGYGYPVEDFQSPWTIDDELDLLGVTLREVHTFAYGETERTGFITKDELRHHLAMQFPVLVGELLDEIVDGLTVMDRLPHGYVYLEGGRGSAVKSWLTSLLSALGPQTFEEAYRAMERHHRARRPGLVFPPRAVIREFVDRDSGFWLTDGVVGLTDGASRELSGVERWVQDTICECSGRVIHRTELWSKARDNGVKGGTLSMYAGYSLYFKPMPGGLLTMTGTEPAEVMKDLARQRASAIRVPTRRGAPLIIGSIVTIPVEAGNDLIDGGTLGSTREIRTMLGGQKFKALVNGEQFGHVNWSGTTMTGFGGVLRELSAQPGDQVLFVFSVVDGEMVAEFALNSD